MKARIVNALWVKMRIFLLENLSITTPAYSEKNNAGRNWTAESNPNLNGEFVICKTSQL
jgi:hypothetical protein